MGTSAMKKQTMKRSELLKEAKKILYTEEGSEFICNAIQMAAVKHKGAFVVSERLIDWISLDLLEGLVCLEYWLEYKHKKKLRGKRAFKMLRDTRMRWIDWMIDYWEARGK